MINHKNLNNFNARDRPYFVWLYLTRSLEQGLEPGMYTKGAYRTNGKNVYIKKNVWRSLFYH